MGIRYPAAFGSYRRQTVAALPIHALASVATRDLKQAAVKEKSAESCNP